MSIITRIPRHLGRYCRLSHRQSSSITLNTLNSTSSLFSHPKPFHSPLLIHQPSSHRQHLKLLRFIPCQSSSSSSFTAQDIQTDLGIILEGNPSNLNDTEINILLETIYHDAKKALQQAAFVAVQDEDRDSPPGPLELSLVLCDDDYIRELNKTWRGKDEPTDVLSFEINDDDDDDDDDMYIDTDPGSNTEGDTATVIVPESLHDLNEGIEDAEDVEDDRSSEYGMHSEPVTLLGDVVISIDTAQAQAQERGHSLLDECRILLVHGILHLLGYDHEDNEEEAEEMARAESTILENLNWKGNGLISAAAGNTQNTAMSSPSVLYGSTQRAHDIRLLALDMDGTLLDSQSKVLPSSVEAIKEAIARGVTVMPATGKARPAAITALQAVGLAGPGLAVSTSGPGIFLQGLAVYGRTGRLIAGGTLDTDIVKKAFAFAQEADVSICGFLGEECITMKMTAEVEELHVRYYEPRAMVVPSIDDVVGGPPMRKLLFLASSDRVKNELLPAWSTIVENTSAQTMQAVPDMLEIVPRGWNKWVGLCELLNDFEIEKHHVMAIGDGDNDYELVAGVGVGIAMGNGVDKVKSVAYDIVASNDEGGVAEAIEKYIL